VARDSVIVGRAVRAEPVRPRAVAWTMPGPALRGRAEWSAVERDSLRQRAGTGPGGHVTHLTATLDALPRERRQNGGVSEEQRRTALTAGIDWAWTIQVQRQRLLEHESLAASSARDRLLRTSMEARRTYIHVDRQPFIELRADKHFMLVAARNLLRALDCLQPRALHSEFPPGLAADVKILRDCLEHWDERQDAEESSGPRGRAYRNFARHHPEEDPASFRFGAGGTFAGGLDLDELASVAESLYDQLVELEASNFVWKGWEFR
jgi:hypothetical protein